jgi:hypothetical protein
MKLSLLSSPCKGRWLAYHKAMATTHTDEKQGVIKPELAKILDERLARVDEDEKEAVDARKAIKEMRRNLKPRT